MIHRAEDIVHVASATVARWQAEALEIIRARQAAAQEGDCFAGLDNIVEDQRINAMLEAAGIE